MIFNDMTRMAFDLTNQLYPLVIGLNLALAVSAVGIFAPAAIESWSGSVRRFVRRSLTLTRPQLAR